MTKPTTPQEILDVCSQITRKRAKTVVDHIAKYGFITNEQLQADYGYDHPPRAIRDVREEGVPLITYKVVSERTGRKIGAYRFGDPKDIMNGRFGGRKAFSKKFKKSLVKIYGSKDTVTSEKWEERYLQIDHRIPYEVGGDASNDESHPEAFMLLHGTSQRKKSWSCEHCDNFNNLKDPNLCKECYWAFPEDYSHVAMSESRHLLIEWNGDEANVFDHFVKKAKQDGLTPQEAIKKLIEG